MADLTTQLQAAAGVGGGWDLSKATLDATYNYIQFNGSLTGDFYIKPDGTSVFSLDSQGNLNEYGLAVPFELSSVTGVVATKYIGSLITIPFTFTFAPDGSAFFTNNTSVRVIYQFLLGTPWDITTLTTSSSASISHSQSGAVYLYMRPDGLNFFFLIASTDQLRRYALTTAYRISTPSLNAQISVFSIDSTPQGFTFKPDGTRLYVVGDTSNDITECVLATAWNISTISQVRTLSVANYAPNPVQVSFNDTGDIMYLGIYTGGSLNIFYIRGILGYSLGTAYDISTAVPATPNQNILLVSSNEISPYDAVYNNDGTIMYVVGTNGDAVDQWALSTPYDVSTGSYTDTLSVAAVETSPTGLYISPDGINLYIIGSSDVVRQYVLGTPWAVNTGSYTGLVFSVLGQTSAAIKIRFRPDGTHMYISSGTTGAATMYDYVLGTPWDCSTASYTGSSYNMNQIIGAGSYIVGGFMFKPDGTKAYLLSFTTSTSISGVPVVYEVTLSTPWDITTMSSTSVTYTWSGLTYLVYGLNYSSLWISDDGLHLLLVNLQARMAFSFSL